MTKRYNCTVHDRRGWFGLCMEKSTSGKFVLYKDYAKLSRKCERLEKEVFFLKEQLAEKSKPSNKSVLGTE